MLHGTISEVDTHVKFLERTLRKCPQCVQHCMAFLGLESLLKGGHATSKTCSKAFRISNDSHNNESTSVGRIFVPALAKAKDISASLLRLASLLIEPSLFKMPDNKI